MNPFTLVREGTDTPVAQACGACGTVYRLEDTRAETCCDRAEEKRRQEASWAERSRKLDEQRRATLARAARVPEAEYAGPVYCDDERMGRGGFFETLGDLRDEYEDDGQALPAEVWACTARRFALDSAGQLIENELESGEWYEDMRDWITGEQALQAAIDAFNAAQKGETWDVDYGRRVVLTPRAEADEVDETAVRAGHTEG